MPHRSPPLRTFLQLQTAVFFGGVLSIEQGSRLEAWKLSGDASFDASSASQSYVAGMSVSPSGLVYALDFPSRSVTILDRRGKQLRTVGRYGAGPGDFQSVGSIGLSENGFWVTDPALRRVTFFDSTGKVQRTTSVASADAPKLSPRANVVRAMANGKLLFQAYEGSAGQPNRADLLGNMALILGDSVHISTDTLARLRPLLGRWQPSSGGRPPKLLLSPIQAPTITAFSADGRSYAVLTQSAVTSTSDTVQLCRFGNVTGARACGTLKLSRRPVLAAHRDKYASLADNASSAKDREAVEAILEPVRYFPSAATALLANDGSIWINRYSPDSIGSWIVVTPDGKPKAELATPARLQLFQVSKDYAWGVQYDTDGVPTVVRLRIKRPTR